MNFLLQNVSGDFRQEEIATHWQLFYETQQGKMWQTVSFELTVSSGTYIRALTELFPCPATLLSLKRTAVHF